MNKKSFLYVTLAVVFAISGCSSTIEPSELKQKYANDASRFMSIDGNRVHYRDEGKRKGEVVLLIHGTASSLHTWNLWANKLKQHFRVVRMDLPGFGLTGPDRADRYEVQDDVRFVSAFLEQLNIGQVHLVGSSLGGRIGWQFALDHKNKVRSLTLINALGYPQESWPLPIELAQWPILDTIMANVSPRFMYAAGLEDVYFDSSLITDELVDRYFELSRYPGNLDAFPKRVKASLDEDSELISAIEVPTLILWGEEDEYFPVRNAHRFNSDIANSKLHVYPNVGHLPMEESPTSSMNHFLEFISALSL